ncbi:MAG: hypothetical protein J5809_01085 [Selenomonadaceae bacterium]|nr:hypothetical protein [Selenomonadaceae bacterium]
MENNYETRIVNYALQTCGFYPLRAMQLLVVDSQFAKAKSTMMNIGALFKLDNSMDLERLAQAVNDLVNAYDIFHCRFAFHPGTDDVCQRFNGEIVPVTVEKISDEEFEQRKKYLQKPYNIINQPLYRIHIFETPTAKYFFIDFFHAIMDGASVMILFWRELDSRYRGKKITHAPLNYADFILDEMKVSPEEFAEGSKFWMEMIKDFDATKHLPPPDVKDCPNPTSESFYFNVDTISQNFFKESHYQEHIFFLAASMLAITKSNGSDSANMNWLHNGRNTMQERRLMGTMIEQYPICWKFEQDLSVGEFISGIEAKMQECMKYRRSIGTAYQIGIDYDSATFIFQKRVLGALNTMMLGGKPAEILEIPINEFSVSENMLDIEVNLSEDGSYLVEFSYDTGTYSEDAMKKFSATFNEVVQAMQDENRRIFTILKG